MQVCGIVAEYNPFHTGHAYQIAQARKLGATHVVAVMSGNFVQRGEPALMDKWTRARAAVLGGADLVVELPVPYAMSVAERFSLGAVKLLQELQVDTICFGSECGDIEKLYAAADALLSQKTDALIPQLLQSGVTYSVAKQKALEQLYGAELASLMSHPNNVLGIEYIIAIKQLQAGIVPQTVARVGASHDSSILGEFCSASALRDLLKQQDLERAQKYIPTNCLSLYREAISNGNLFEASRLDDVVLSYLRRLSLADLANLPDVSEGLENRIYNAVRTGKSLQEVLLQIKTKRYTLARIRRILLCGWLGLTKDIYRELTPYIHVLGMNSKGAQMITKASKLSQLPISHSIARLQEQSESAKRFAGVETLADDLYGMVTAVRQPCGRTYTQKLTKVDEENSE